MEGRLVVVLGRLTLVPRVVVEGRVTVVDGRETLVPRVVVEGRVTVDGRVTVGLLGRFAVDGLLTVVAGFVLYTLFGFGRGVVTAGRGAGVPGRFTVVLF